MNRTEMADRRGKAMALYVRGATTNDIARQMGISHQMVSKLLAQARTSWQHRHADMIDSLVGEALMHLQQAEIEAWRAWDRSKEDKETRVTERIRSADGSEISRAVIRREARDGDPRFLAAIRACCREQCLLLGVYPTGHEHQEPDKISIEAIDAVLKAAGLND